MSFLDKNNSDAKRYEHSKEDLSYKELKFAGWYVRNKATLRNVLVGVLLLWSVCTLGYSLVSGISYAAIGFERDAIMSRNAVREFSDYTQLQPLFAPQPLAIASTKIIFAGNEKRSAITEVRNPNTDWVAIVTFQYAGQPEEIRQTQRVMPESRTLLAVLGSTNVRTGAQLRVQSIRWERIDAHQIPIPKNYITSRIQPLIADLSIERYSAANNTPASVTFQLTNNSAYGYWEANYYTIFYNGESIVAVRPLIIEQFRPGARETVQFNFGNEDLSITDVELISNIYVFDNNVYLPVS